jgi:hypothetical protein
VFLNKQLPPSLSVPPLPPIVLAKTTTAPVAPGKVQQKLTALSERFEGFEDELLQSKEVSSIKCGHPFHTPMHVGKHVKFSCSCVLYCQHSRAFQEVRKHKLKMPPQKKKSDDEKKIKNLQTQLENLNVSVQANAF